MTSAGALAGRRVLITRPREQSGELRRRLSALGAVVVDAPAISIVQLEDSSTVPVTETLRRIGDFAWVLVTSPNGARILLDRLRMLHSADPGSPRVAAVGPGTAQVLRAGGLNVDVVPEDHHGGEALLSTLAPLVTSGERVLLVQVAGGSPVLSDGLRALGVDVTVLPLYRTVPRAIDAPALNTLLEQGQIDAVLFASGSAVRALVTALGAGVFREPQTRRPRVVCLGDATAAVVRAAGIPVDRMAARATPEAFVNAVVEALAGAEVRS